MHGRRAASRSWGCTGGARVACSSEPARSTGGWSRWRGAAPEPEDGPDARRSKPARRAGWRIGSPWWVQPSDRIETRIGGPRHHESVRTSCGAPSCACRSGRQPPRSTPPIVPRLSWGADESIRRGPPTFAPALRFAIVHHTAGANDYSSSEAAAVVRAIQLYHVQGNGWNDIGYNFLVDRFGTIYEGRYGGVDRNVVGAHALGFNSGSVGIAVLGTYGSTSAVARGPGRARPPDRLAARPRPRRSDRPHDRDLRRERALRERAPGSRCARCPGIATPATRSAPETSCSRG